MIVKLVTKAAKKYFMREELIHVKSEFDELLLKITELENGCLVIPNSTAYPEKSIKFENINIKIGMPQMATMIRSGRAI